MYDDTVYIHFGFHEPTPTPRLNSQFYESPTPRHIWADHKPTQLSFFLFRFGPSIPQAHEARLFSFPCVPCHTKTETNSHANYILTHIFGFLVS